MPTHVTDRFSNTRVADDERKDPYSEILALARSGTSKHRYLSGVLRSIAGFYASPYAALHVRYASQVVQDDCHFGAGDPAFWKHDLQQFLTDSLSEPKLRAKLLRAKTGAAQVVFLSAPILDPSGPAIGAVALVAPLRADQDPSERLARLESMVRLASFSAEFLGAERPTPGGAANRPAKLGNTGGSTARELAFALTNELRNKIGAEMTALGWVRRERIEILSISGLDEIRKDSPGVAALRAAMEECLDARSTIGCQIDDTSSAGGPFAGYRLHKQWHQTTRGDAVASVPLLHDGRPVAILSLRRNPRKPWCGEELGRIRSQVESYVGTLLLAQKAGRGLCRHALDSLRGAMATLWDRDRHGRRVTAAALILGGCWFVMGTLPYRVSVPCTVTASSTRHIAAPFDAALASAEVSEGDRVQKGDILCRFDTRDLALQKDELQAQRDVLEFEQNRALADQSPYEVRLAQVQKTFLESRLAILDRRIEQAAVRAPLDGLVVAGDLRRRVGEVFARGMPLFQVAPLVEWTLELEIPEVLADEFRSGHSGEFALHAQPNVVLACQLLRIRPSAEQRGRRNVYVAEAGVDAAAGLRPGMQGFARMDLGRRAVWWITLHRAVDYLRMQLWL